MGGMSAFIPVKGDEDANRAAMNKVRADKLREVVNGHDGTWVAHPALVPVALESFGAVTGPKQLAKIPGHIPGRDGPPAGRAENAQAPVEGFDASLEEASRDLGETAWMTFWRVTFPLVLPGVVSSLLLTFIVSFDDFMIAFFLSGTDATLPVYIWGELRFPARLPRVLALGATILVVSGVLIVLAEWLRQSGTEQPQRAEV